MSLVRKVIGLGIRGAVAGALLAWAAPAKGLSVGVGATTTGCSCANGTNSGKFKCNATNSGCDPGATSCLVMCS